MKRSTKAILWITIFLLLILSPLIILLAAPRPAGREFWREFSVALGFVGLALMGLQYIPTTRLGFLSNVFPMDVMYEFHHKTSILSFFLILAHPLLLFINNPYTLRLLNLATAPMRARAATVALLLLVMMMITSIWRERLKLKYERWHAIHDIGALIISVLALYHIFKVDYYTAVPLQRGLWILMAIIWGGMFAYTRAIKPMLLLRKPYKVTRIQEERGNSWTLTVEPVDHPGITFQPGQVAWLTVGKAPFSIMEHPFSFSSSAERPERLQFTIRELGDFTSTVKDLQPGSLVYLDGPYGVFDIGEEHEPGSVFVAGGIGSAPILSILRTLADQGDQRPALLIYGSYDWESVTFREALEYLKRRMNLEIVHVLESPHPGWEGERGYVTTEMLDRHLPPDRNERLYFVCGPLPMIHAVERILDRLGIPRRNIHVERYKMA